MNIYLKFPSKDSQKCELLEIRIQEIDQNASPFDSLLNKIESDLNLEKSQFTLASKNGISLNAKSCINQGDIIQICPTVLGGKGGFGSLLRSFGKQITKSTNRDACRDLTGRRMKHVNNEKRLQEFLQKQAELAKEKERKKKEKCERRRQKLERLESGAGDHVFLDPQYDQDRQKINRDLEEAINKATKKNNLKQKTENLDEAKPSTTASTDSSDEERSNNSADLPAASADQKDTSKSIANNANSKKTQDIATTKFKDWLGVDVDVSSDDSDHEIDEQTSCKKIKMF